MDTYVADTSVILKWFNQENESNVEIAHQIYKDMLDYAIISIIQNLLVIELVNALNKGKHMPLATIKKSIRDLFALPLTIKDLTQTVLEQTAEIVDAQIATYDALFVATAKDADCKLISDDKKAHGKITDGT